MPSVTFTVEPWDGEPTECANPTCSAEAKVAMSVDGVNHDPAPCCGNATCQFAICMALATEEQ